MTDLSATDQMMLESIDLSQGLDAVIKIRFTWSVSMPGEITDTNSDLIEDGVASFTVKIDDRREELYVVSRTEKPGACNR